MKKETKNEFYDILLPNFHPVFIFYLEERIKDSICEQEEGKVPSAASAACPEGWIESLERCFYFANTGED